MNHITPDKISTDDFELRINQLLDLIQSNRRGNITMLNGNHPISDEEFSFFKNKKNIIKKLNLYNTVFNDFPESENGIEPIVYIECDNYMGYKIGVNGADYIDDGNDLVKISEDDLVLMLEVFTDFLVYLDNDNIPIPPYTGGFSSNIKG